MAKRKGNMEGLFAHAIADRALETYNPWWTGNPLPEPPEFRRDAFAVARDHISAEHRLALLINGPRRVGKTTIMRQLIRMLLIEQHVEPARVFFFSMDDPVIQQLPAQEQGDAFEQLMRNWEDRIGTKMQHSGEPLYCFLDEVQRLPRWELYIKRYVDLGYPVRFVISGSASHTIFRKSLESLLGRMVDVSLPPFTFREWLRYHHPEYEMAIAASREVQVDIQDRESVSRAAERIMAELSDEGLAQLNTFVGDYARMGGFPQLWDMRDPVERSQFIDLQYVQRVTLEDLLLVREIRRPEVFHQFLRYAFARTGEEYNLEALAKQIHASRATLTDALPLLLQTELITKVDRFTNKPVRLRSTHARLYAADLSLYGAVSKLTPDLTGPDRGRLAETIVCNALRRFAGVTDMTYYRTPDGKREVDFILRVGNTLVPLEVKSGIVQKGEDRHVRHFLKDYGDARSFGIVVHTGAYANDGICAAIPIGVFLLL